MYVADAGRIMGWHTIEAAVRYLTTAEGGRTSGVASGYRGQFFYDGEDCDGFQFFPDYEEGETVRLGDTVRVHIEFPPDRWEQHHSKRIYVGMPFEIREGRKAVGNGTVTALAVSPENRR